MKKKIGHWTSCLKMFQDPKSKISHFNVVFYLGAGHVTILSGTLKWAKTNFFKTFVKPGPWGGCLL